MTDQLLYEKSFKRIVLLTTSILILYISLIYIVDPLQLFRKSNFYQPIYHDELYQNPGIAKNQDYDTVIIGSSVSENFQPSFIYKELGMHAVKLTLQAATSHEEKIILDTALATGKVKNVIIGLDDFSFKNNDFVRIGFPYYLYRFQNIKDKFKYLLNIGNASNIFQIILAKVTHHKNLGLEGAYSWQQEFSKKKVMNDWDILNRNHLNIESVSLETMKNNFYKNILKNIKNNPQVQFYLFYPPYSYLAYKKMYTDGELEKFLKFKLYVFDMAQHCDNVKIFDFQSDFKITNNLDNYKDIIHYSQNINDYIISNFKKNRHLVTVNNVENLNNELFLQAKSSIQIHLNPTGKPREPGGVLTLSRRSESQISRSLLIQ